MMLNLNKFSASANSKQYWKKEGEKMCTAIHQTKQIQLSRTKVVVQGINRKFPLIAN